MSDAYGKLLERIKDLGRLDAIEALLDWDQQGGTVVPDRRPGPRMEDQR